MSVSAAARPRPKEHPLLRLNYRGRIVSYLFMVATVVTLLLVPVLYAIFVIDLRLIAWTAKREL